MNDFVNGLARFSSPFDAPVPSAKAQEVERASLAKKAALGGPNSMTVPEIRRAYQDPGAVFQNSAFDASLDRSQRFAERTDGEAILDSYKSVADGAVSSTLGLGALGIGLFSDIGGDWATRNVGNLSETIRASQSGGLNARREAFARDNAKMAEENTKQFAEDRKTDGDFLAGLKRIGRDAYGAVANAAGDSTILSDGIANGVGSMLVGGPLARGLKVAGNAALKGATMAAPSLLFSERAARLATLGSKAAMPASIGLMEGGGTYQQTFQESMERLKDRADLTDEQKRELANQAALEAAAIQTPIAAATGVLTSKFEASPFHVPNVRSAAGNMIKEAIEEGIQSGTSQLATNKGIQDNVDATADLSAGVGEQVGLGALYGMGTGGVVQAPGIALRGAVDAAKLTGRTAVNAYKSAVAGFEARIDQVNNQIKNESPVAPARMDQIYTTAVQAAPQIQAETVQAINEATDVTPEQKAATLDYVDQFFNDVTFSDQEADALAAPVGDIVRGSTDRFDAIKRAAAVAVDEQADAQTRLMSALYLEGAVTKYAPSLQETIERIPDEHPALDQLRTFEDVLISLGQDPRIAQAVSVAQNFAKNFNEEDISDKNIQTERGQYAAQNVVNAVSVDPTRVEPAVIDTVLKHATQNKIQLTADQRAYLETASNLNRIEREYQEAGGRLGLTNSEIVTRQIRSDKGNRNSTGPSAAEHLKGIFEAVRAGKLDVAKERMGALTDFAQSLQNKVAALNESLQTDMGTQVSYEAYNPKTRQFFKSTTPVFLNGRSENSVQTAQNIALDAQAVAEVQSSLARSFPQLGFASIEQNRLNGDIMNQPADQAARQYRARIQEQKSAARRASTAQRLANDPRSATGSQAQSDNGNRQSEDSATSPLQQSKNVATPDQSTASPEPSQQQDRSEATVQEARPSQTETLAETVSAPKEETSVPAPQVAELDQQAEPETSEASEVEEEAAPAVQDDDVTSDDGLASTPVSAMDTAFPNLLGSPEGRGRNLFKQAFNLPAEAISRLSGLESPFLSVREALSSGSKFRSFVGDSASSTKLSDDTVAVYKKLMGYGGPIAKAMNQQLQAALSKNAKFMEKDGWNSYKEYRAANIADNVDGKISYNPELQQGAILSALQWFLQADQRQRPLNDDDVAKILGFEPTSEQVELFNQGLYYNGAVTDLTDSIIRYWGVKSNANTGLGVVRGVPEGVAKELLRAMEAAKLIEVNSFKVGDKTYRQISFNTETLFNEDERRALMANPTMIEAASMIEPEQMVYIGQAPTTTPRTQLRNPEVQLTAQQQKMVQKEQNTPFYVVPHMLNFLRSLGPQGAVNLFGYGNIDNRPMNEAHKTSLTSVNRTIHAAFDAIDAMATRAEQVGSEQGNSLDQVPIYYAYEFTSVNRLQMLGKHNPQASKLAREVIMPTRATVDMTDDLDRSRFWLAVAQAWGEKVHKQQRNISVEKAQAMAKGKYAPVVELLQDWLQKGQVDRALELTDEQVQKIRTAFDPSGKKPVAPVMFYAAMEIARLNNADEKTRKAFDTSLYVEADGITDGPMNAMVHMVGGAFTKNWIEILRKGGLYFDRRGATSNDQGNIKDLYQVTADAFKNALSKLQRDTNENGPVRDSLASLIRLSGSLLGDLTYDPETNQLLDISRGAVKNPLTVVIYGAGDRGIANKITSGLIKAIYERMSDELQFAADNPNATDADRAQFLYPGVDATTALANYKKYEQDIARLMLTRVEEQDGKLTHIDARTRTKLPDVRRGNEKFQFTADMIQNMQENVLSMFVKPLQEGIQANIGETVTGTTMLRQATQVQSIYLQYAYQRAVQEALDKREAQSKTDNSGWQRSDFLSQRELQDIRAKLKYLSPFIETGTQNMLISGSERTPMLANEGAKSTVEFSRSLDGNGFTGGYMSGYTNAGVSGIPKMTIATGDGQMMQNFSANPDIGDGYMLIFDGANFRLPDVESYSEKINKAVYDGWMGNPMAAVSKTFTDFVRLADLENISDTGMVEDLTYALTGKRGAAEVTELVEGIKQLQTGLDTYAKEIQARKNVLTKVQMSVDHMASAGASYSSDIAGESLEGLTSEQAAARLNEMLAQENARTASSGNDTITSVSGANLRDLVRATSLTGENKTLFADAVRRAEQLGYSVVTGGATNRFAGQDVNGYIETGSRTIYLTNPSEETLFHELIHAATIEQVYSHYLNDGSLTSEQTAAVQRIEGLMNEWLGNADAFTNLNFTTRQAADNARAAISEYLTQNTPAGQASALNEFMAWVLANQNLNQVASLTKVKNPILRIAKEVLGALKNLFGFRLKVGDDLLSNLRFNTRVLIAGSQNPGQVLIDTVLYQSGNFGTNDRLTQIGQQFTDMIARKIDTTSNPAARLKEMLKADEAYIVADQVTTSVIANGFPMDMQAKSTFQMMLAAFSADIALDPNALSRAQELFNHVSKMLKVEDFMQDVENETEADRYQAQAKYDTVVGTRGVRSDGQGRSTLVPAFMALALVDEGFRSILARMDLPKTEREANTSLDNILTNAGTSAMERLGIAMAGERQNSASVNETLDALTDQITSIAQDRAGFIDQAAAPVGNAIDAANNWMVGAMSAASKAVANRAEQIRTTSNNKIAVTGANFAKLLAGVFDRDVAGDLSMTAMSAMNKSDIWQPVQDLLNELVGRTDENADVYDMIKQVRSVIQSLRQQYREHLPELIQKQFSRDLTADEQTAMYKGLAKTDLASLRSGYSVSQILELVTDASKLATETSTIEKRIRQSRDGKTLIDKSQQLATFLNTGKPGSNLLRNAHAIANLFGTGIRVEEASSVLVMDIDHLVSLYALEGLNQKDKQALASLVQDEAEGMNFVISYLEGQRKEELAGAANDPAIQANLYKGYVPSEQQGGVGLIVADDAEFVELRKRGYERVADYEGADAEYGKSKKGYYFSPVSGRSAYSQGIVQTVHTTVSGINAATGFTTSEMTAGRITDPKTVDKITKLMSRQKGGKEQLLPVFDGTGKVVAYERSVDPLEIQRLNKSTDLSKMLGAWRGRQAEEAMANRYNHALIDKLHAVWDGPDQLARKGEFVNLLDKRELAKDPVLADAVKLIPYDTLSYIAEKYGSEGSFMVRRDMLNDALGYRQASVGDAWTGTTRWSPEVQKGVQNVATAVFGADAYKRMIQAEKFIQNRVTDARVMIVVKSIVVPMTNLIANVYQLSARGVPIAQTVRSMPKKTAEINAYVNGRLRKIELEGLLRAAGSDVVAQRKHSAEIQSIEDNWKRLSIYPLIQAGEFASVSDVGLGKEDIDITEGRLSAYVEKLVDRMPEGIKTAAKYAIVSKDTALFKGLQKTVEYGDFLAKAVLYDYLTQTKDETSQEALGKVTEEFVNYDRLPGRARSYLDNMGLLWFWNFKVRSAKVAVSMIRNNPLHAMLSMMAPAPPFIGSVGNPITDNIVAVAADGRLDNSMGPSQGFRSMELIPWLNLVG